MKSRKWKCKMEGDRKTNRKTNRKRQIDPENTLTCEKLRKDRGKRNIKQLEKIVNNR